jgi:protein-L-isoaspartate(D-aspartate) O-methyltransferase
MTDPQLLDKAFAMIDRRLFLPPGNRPLANVDQALPIGYGQTNSQPYTIRLMLEWLDLKPDQKILDVGAGSGWTTALLGHIVSPKGEVLGVERIPELVEFGSRNIDEAGIRNTRILPAGDQFGLPDEAPFDRILVSASSDELPDDLVKQLKNGGKMVIPVQDEIWQVTKKPQDHIGIKKLPGRFAFVPLL